MMVAISTKTISAFIWWMLYLRFCWSFQAGQAPFQTAHQPFLFQRQRGIDGGLHTNKGTFSSFAAANELRASGKRRAIFPATKALVSDQLLTGIAINIAWPLVFTVLGQQSLTTSGLVNAGILGTILWGTLGWQGFSVAAVYFLLGSGVTKIKMAEKEKLGIAEKRGGRRGPENVWGSAATGAICAIAAQFFPGQSDVCAAAFLASFATKLSDTFGSEVGKAYGKTTYLITTLRPVPKGTEGAVSLEGTLAGVVGSLLLAGYGAAIGMVARGDLGPIAAAAFLACNVESYLGATTQGKYSFLTNEFINFINTTVGALIVVALKLFL